MAYPERLCKERRCGSALAKFCVRERSVAFGGPKTEYVRINNDFISLRRGDNVPIDEHIIKTSNITVPPLFPS